MDTFEIKVNGKTYTTSKITVANSIEAIKINAEILELTKLEGSNETDDAISLYNKLNHLLIRQLTLIRSVYADQFTIDELQNSLTRAELEVETNNIMRGVSGILSKN